MNTTTSTAGIVTLLGRDYNVANEQGDATPEAAVALQKCYNIISAALKARTSAMKKFLAGTIQDREFGAAMKEFAGDVGTVRSALHAIPANAVASSTATRQTIYVEFFNGVDAALAANMTKTDAKAANVALKD